MNITPGRLAPLVVICLALLLGACSKEPAGFRLTNAGGDNSLTIERSKGFFLSAFWDLDLIVANLPQCQRRYSIKPAPDLKFRIDVYRRQPDFFIVNQGRYWYAVESTNCEAREFDDEPAEVGEYIGSFRERDGLFLFVPYPSEEEQ